MEEEQTSPQSENGDKPNFQWLGTGHEPAGDPASPSGDEDDRLSPHGNKPPAPAQKRRRVTRACDECRRKKIKCDGKQPCTHCTVYSYECTYDQPSNRRRNPTPQYIEALEFKLKRAEAILKNLLPNVDLNDPNIATALLQSAPQLKPPSNAIPPAPAQAKSGGEGEGDSLLESMVQDTGSLDLDDQGRWDFHGHSSGMVFLQRLRQQFGDMLGQAESINTMMAKPRHYLGQTYAIDSPKSASDSPCDHWSSVHIDLPPKDEGMYLCELTMSNACSLMRFMHKPTLFKHFHRIYDTPDSQWGNEEHRYLPLLFALMAVGTMFANSNDSKFQQEGYAGSIDNGLKWFKAARSLMDITDCRDLPSLQAIICMIMFLQSTAKLSTCWCYVGIALHSAIRMGLHRSITASFNPVELESRKRLFWQIRKMDVYVGAMIGLPTMLSDNDIDQELPLSIDDEFITIDKILPAPSGHIHLMAGSNAQATLMAVLRKVIKYVYPIKGVQYMQDKSRSYVVAHAKIREIERDLQHWMEDLPMFLRPGGEVSPELARVQQLLRMAYAYVQMFLYRPFLHYVSKSSHRPNTNRRSYACAAACVSVSRNVIHITQEMSKRGLLIGSFWFVMYTTFLAIMALVFFALENPESRSSEEIIQDAITGKEILAGLAKNSMAADRCTQTLQQLFDKLPDRLKGGRTRPLATSSHKKRQAVSPAPTTSTSTSGPSVIKDTQRDESGPRRALSFPVKTGQDISYDQPQYAITLKFNEPYPQPATGNNMGIGPDNLAQASTNGSLAFTHAGLQPSHMPQATTYGLPDLSAMMFPTGDPFAYPNQPMTTLEDHNFVNTPDSCGQGGAPPGSTHSAHSPSRTSSIFSVHQQTCNPDGGAGGSSSSSSMNDVTGSNGGFDPSVEAHIFDPLQPYLSGAEYQQGMADLMAGLGPIDGGAGEGDGKSGAEFGNWWSANPSAAANWGL